MDILCMYLMLFNYDFSHIALDRLATYPQNKLPTIYPFIKQWWCK